MRKETILNNYRLHLILLMSIFVLGGAVPGAAQAVIDHSCCDLSAIPAPYVDLAKDTLVIAYQHTSHGSQIPSGMSMVNSMNPGGQYDYANGGGTGAIDFRDYAMSSYSTPAAQDLGNPNRYIWETATRNYIAAHPEVNVIMWSWCGQVDASEADIANEYLARMESLETDFPDITFVYMTGHLNGTGETGNVYARNNQIRNYCITNGKVLFDFADIESYDPDGSYFRDLNSTDTCAYDGGNWAVEWCTANGNPAECTSCSSCAHSECLNCYQKGQAFWNMTAQIAGWDGVSPTKVDNWE